MKLIRISDKKEYIPVIAQWFHDEWAHLNPGRTLDDIVQMIHDSFNSPKGIIYVATINEKPVSSISFRESELDDKPDLSPWMSSLVVESQSRNQGIGKKTISLFKNHCKKEGIKSLYLFTENHSKWYESLGWEPVEEARFKGHCGMTMKTNL